MTDSDPARGPGPAAVPATGQPSVLTRPARPPDLVLPYGAEDDQVADVYLPETRSGLGAATGAGTICVLFFHGGFWRAAYGREHARPLAEALAASGFLVCLPEYRRTGQPGGGWPGTFDDAAAAVDHVPSALKGEVGPIGEVILAGHSAGGHLALWAASRHRLPAGSPWRAEPDLVTGVVALAAVSDLGGCFAAGLGQDAAGALMGGGPQEVPERYAAADPMPLAPPAAPVRLVHGAQDDRVPVTMSLDYAQRVRMSGADAECEVLPGLGHFEPIDPLSSAWLKVLGAFRALT